MVKLLVITVGILLLVQFTLVSTSSSYWEFLHWGTSPPSAHTVATWTRCLFFFLKGVLLPSVVSIAVWFRGEAMTVYAIYLRELHQRNLQGHHLFYCFRVGASVFRNLSVFGYYDERMSFFPNTASYHKVVSGCMGPCWCQDVWGCCSWARAGCVECTSFADHP